MNSKIVAAMAVFCFIAVLAAPVAAEETGSALPNTDYVSQLDENGRNVYDDVTGRFDTELSGSAPSRDLSFTIFLTDPVLFSTAEEATAYAQGIVQTALAAIYYTDAEAIWLWDLPISAPEVTVECGSVQISYDDGRVPGTYSIPVSVSFTVSVPTDFVDNPDTTQNEIYQAITDLRNAASEITVTAESVPDKVIAIARALDSVRMIDDRDPTEATEDQEADPGSVSNAYDALVTGESSSAGIAMAFTYLCELNGITASTVKGTVVTNADGATETGYWNVLWDGERWYAADVTIYDGDGREPLMAGMSTMVYVSDMTAHRGFGSTHVADLDLATANSLNAVTVPADGYDWPDDRTFFEKYGTHVMAVIITAIIVGVIIYALKKGDL